MNSDDTNQFTQKNSRFIYVKEVKLQSLLFTCIKFIYSTQSIIDLSLKWYCLEFMYTFDLIHWFSVCPQVMPGLLLCFVLRYDAYKKTQTNSVEAGVPPPPTYVHKVTYFHCSLIGYFLGKIHVLAPTWTTCTCTYQVNIFGSH